MISSLIIAFYFNFIDQSYENWEKIVFGSLLTTIVWIAATYFTPPDSDDTLRNFVKKVNPGGPGWTKFSELNTNEPWPVPIGILCMILGCISIYSVLLGVGQLIYGHNIGFGLIGLSLASALALMRLWK